MIKTLLLLSCITLSSVFNAQIERPKLIVGIVVDQMRMEYLYRYNPYFSPNGFKKLMNEGFVYTNMHYNYVPTHTAPGHASIFTGTTPVNHGIMGNYWYDKENKRTMYCTDDSTVKPLGNPAKEKEGFMSPKNLQSSTITDELKLSTNFRSKVYGVSFKDRGAILPAGHFANRAYWMSENGNFISSTFYGNDFPKWVVTFNNEKRFMKYINQGWNLLRDKSVYKESIADENPYEKLPINEDSKSVFPYDLKASYAKKGGNMLQYTPFTDDLIVEFVKELITHEELGKDEDTDFLTVSFSAPDKISHNAGPRSMEVQDTYLRLDENIADFISYLDKKVGKGNYLIFLTADHSGAENPQYLTDHGYPAKATGYKEYEKILKDFSIKSFGKDYIARFFDTHSVYLDEESIKNDNKDITEIISKTAAYIETLPEVKRVYTRDEILNASPTDEHASMIFKGYDKKQSGQLYILFKPANMIFPNHGTNHGTSYTYDTHVPGIFYGWKIPKGVSHKKQYITEIAPTISQKISITFPNSTSAQTLSEILVNK